MFPSLFTPLALSLEINAKVSSGSGFLPGLSSCGALSSHLLVQACQSPEGSVNAVLTPILGVGLPGQRRASLGGIGSYGINVLVAKI